MKRHALAKSRRCASTLLTIILAAGSHSITFGDEPALPAPIDRKIDFQADVQPIFAAACYSCHDAKKQQSDYRLDDKQSALHGGSLGGAILPGNSAESPLIRYVAGLEDGMLMPVEGERLSAEQIGILRAWIDQGANWPDTSAPTERSDHWAYQPLQQPDVPQVQHGDWVRTPIDAFILSKLEQHGFSPSTEADKRALIRRLSFNLIGLPPTPEEVNAFLADDSTDAYERLVDRLLASPRYGERWSRHWIDVVHFAETHGNDQDRPRPNAWPYRDYLIRSFNDDLPYARFVEQQLAGDVLFPEEPEVIAATGFVAAGPWDESSQMCIVDDTVDKRQAQNLDRDDMVSTTMSTFVSATVHCARCHNHKFDPISQADYYSLQAVFAGVDRVDRPFDVDPATHAARTALIAERAALDSSQVPTSKLLSEEVQQQVSAWEASSAMGDGPWTVLAPESFSSSAGATATRLEDGSVLVGGKAAEVDTYRFTVRTNLQDITAIQVEVLADESLPHQGPGRNENGNLHLSEVRVQAAPQDDPSAAHAVPLRNASADFDQQGWTAAMAIDGNPQTAWGVHPEVGKSHRAAFEFQQTVGFEQGTILTVVLDQTHGRHHLIGRPRISVTTSPHPVRVSNLPAAIASILAIPAEQRTDAQRADLALHVLKRRIDEQIAALPPAQMVYAIASNFAPQNNLKPAGQPRAVHVLRRGDINQPLDIALPGALGCLADLPSRFELSDPNDEGSRRAALAHWIVDPKNALTWRSIVNRVWHYHFGRGIVDTPNDFGQMGSKPSHPELLDWLALWFRDQGGSLKQLHRLIVTSAVYRQSSSDNREYSQVDADNRLLWRMNSQRLDAESVRDGVLQITGMLDLTMGGPSVKQFVQSPGIHVTPKVDYESFDVDSSASRRRTIYRFLFRTLPDPFMESMDCPDASQLTPSRSASVTPLQALAMLNDHFIVRQSEHFAARVTSAGQDLSARIAMAYELALNRPPTENEIALLSDYAARHGMANVCRLILNSNEFMFVH